MYYGNILSIVIYLLIFLVLTIVISIFSPFGIFFAVFSFLRAYTKNPGLRKTSLIFQIIMVCLTFVIGLLIALLFLLQDFGETWPFSLVIVFGVGFVVSIEVIIIKIFEFKPKLECIELKTSCGIAQCEIFLRFRLKRKSLTIKRKKLL